MTKPIVRYRTDLPCHIMLGLPAFVHPVDHPNHIEGHNVSNTTYVLTSKVVGHDALTGEFETLNTRYAPYVT